jgi:outer membrane protein OmpA-like peptidoglycan-associated protein
MRLTVLAGHPGKMTTGKTALAEPEECVMTRWQKFTTALASVALAAGLVFATTAPSLAQRPTEEQMLNALKPPQKTRGLTQSPKDIENQRFIDQIRTVKTRQLTLGERQKVSEIAKTKPAIDLEIYFDYNSSAITSQAEPELMKLGRVLTNPEITGNVFLIGGHTDAKGGSDYNQQLSERRAAAVKKFLKERFDIVDEALVTAGYGKEQLKNTTNPYAAENRRVQVVNLDQKATASGR